MRAHTYIVRLVLNSETLSYNLRVGQSKKKKNK